MDDITSASLVAQLQTMEPEAWSRLTQLYGPLVYGWARRAGFGDNDAADIGQEVFRTVASRIGSFQLRQNGGTFRGWLWTITRHKLGELIRRRQNNPAAIGGTEANIRLHDVPDPVLDEESIVQPLNEQTQLVRRALDLIRQDFEEHTWTAFWRSAVDGHPTAVIAADLEMNAKAVRQAKYRVIRRLRAELD